MPFLIISQDMPLEIRQKLFVSVYDLLRKNDKRGELIRGFFCEKSQANNNELNIIDTSEEQIRTIKKGLASISQAYGLDSPITLHSYSVSDIFRGEEDAGSYRKNAKTTIASLIQKAPPESKVINVVLEHPDFDSEKHELFKKAFCRNACKQFSEKELACPGVGKEKAFFADDLRFFFRKGERPNIRVFHRGKRDISDAIEVCIQNTLDAINSSTIGYSETLAGAYSIQSTACRTVLLGDEISALKIRNNGHLL